MQDLTLYVCVCAIVNVMDLKPIYNIKGPINRTISTISEDFMQISVCQTFDPANNIW